MRKILISSMLACSFLMMGVATTSLPGCGTTTSPSPALTFNDKAALTVKTATLVSQAATALLRAEKITLQQDQTIHQQLDLIVRAVTIAKSLESKDPTNAAAQLESASASLDALKKQTGVTP